MTKIELKLTEGGQRWECTVCGSFERGYRAEYRAESGRCEVSVCENCIKAEDIDDRLQRHADEFDRHANWVRGLIGKLKVPTFADLQRCRAEEAAEAERRSSWFTLCNVLNTPAAEITAPEVGA